MYEKVTHDPIGWKNKRVGGTSLSAENLNKMDEDITKIAEQLNNAYQDLSGKIEETSEMVDAINGEVV